LEQQKTSKSCGKSAKIISVQSVFLFPDHQGAYLLLICRIYAPEKRLNQIEAEK